MIAKKMMLASAVVMAGVAAEAAFVTVAPVVSYAYEKDSMTQKFDAGQLYLLVADTNGDGFGINHDGTIGPGFALGADDLVLKALNTVSSPGAYLGQLRPNATGLTLDGVQGELDGKLSTGDKFGIFFFDNLSTTDYASKTLNGGEWYGFYTRNEFSVPAAGASYVSSFAGQALTTDQQVIPEPASFVMALLGGVLACLPRRNRNRQLSA
jgi:hypothetical protein